MATEPVLLAWRLSALTFTGIMSSLRNIRLKDVDHEEAMKPADVISLHVNLSDETRNLVTSKAFRRFVKVWLF